MATTVSVARIGAKQHFPSDVLVGAAIGYLTSEYVYRTHHKPELPGAAWDFPAVRQGLHSNWPAKFMGSPYVPLDSRIYPALERLAALGYVNSAIVGMRPWTRMECANQVSEAADRITDDDAAENKAARLYRNLLLEFRREVNCWVAETMLRSAWNQPIPDLPRSQANHLQTGTTLDRQSIMNLAAQSSKGLTMFLEVRIGFGRSLCGLCER